MDIFEKITRWTISRKEKIVEYLKENPQERDRVIAFHNLSEEELGRWQALLHNGHKFNLLGKKAKKHRAAEF